MSDPTQKEPRVQQFAGRSVVVLAVAYGLSSFGDILAVVSLMLRTAQGPGSGWAVSGILLASFAPIVVAGPLLGPFVDRFDHQRLIALVGVGQGLAAAALVWVQQPGLVLTLVALIATGGAAVTPALLAMVPRLCGEEQAVRGYGVLEAARNVGMILGPVAAGTLVATGGVDTALLTDAASFVIVAAATLALSVPDNPTPDASPAQSGWAAQVRAGAHVVYGNPLLRTPVIGLIAAVAFSTMANTLLVFYSNDTLHSGPALYGWLVGIQSVGSLIVATHIAQVILRLGHLPILIGATALLGLTRITMAVLPGVTIALIACLIGGACVTLQNLALRDLVRALVSPELRGRAFATVGSTLTAANLAGTASGGPVVALANPQIGLLISGAGTIAAAALALLRPHRRPCAVGLGSVSRVLDGVDDGGQG